MQVIILAAGRGNRLSPLTDSVPKPLVEVNGTPLIVNALDILAEYPVERFVVVVGYRAEQLRTRLGQSHNGVPIEYVENSDWDRTNNIHSLWLTRELWDRDTMLLECDIFFEPALIKELLSGPFANTVMVDRFAPHMDGTVVELSRDMSHITRMIPAKDQDENFDFSDKYKTVNIYTFTRDFLESIFRPTMELYMRMSGQNEYYELVLGVIIFMGNKALAPRVCAPHRWFEIDDFTDLQRAEAHVADGACLLQKLRASYGGYWRYDFTDFEYLYNPYFPNQNLLNELRLNLGDLLCNYPSGQVEINRSLANWARVDEDLLAVGNGGSELIELLKGRIRKLALLRPSFAEYERHLAPEQLHALAPSGENMSHAPLQIVKEVRASGANALVLVNPNNPTGARFSPKELRFILSSLRELDMIILDESFADFMGLDDDTTMLGELEQHPNLVILRSLSKDLGIPGLRLGYIASANRALIRESREALPIWHINSLAQHFLDILPKYRLDYAEARRKVIAAREAMAGMLAQVPGLRTLPSHANYFCCELPEGAPSHKVQEHLFLRHRMLVKDLGDKQGLPKGRWLRLAVKTPEENEALVAALTQTLAEFGFGRLAA